MDRSLANWLCCGCWRLPLLAGCMPDTPETAFNWGVNDQLSGTA